MYFYSLNLVLERSQTRSVDQKDALPPPVHSTDTIVPSQFPIIHSFHCYWGKKTVPDFATGYAFLVSYDRSLPIPYQPFYSTFLSFPFYQSITHLSFRSPLNIYDNIYISFL